MSERYLVYKDFNTKDWIVYDEETNKNVCREDTEEKANLYKDLLMEQQEQM